MLDLITMTMAAGVQEELNTVRKETGVESPLTTEAVEPSVSPVSQASADIIETCTDAVESVASTLFDALPSFSMFNGLEIEWDQQVQQLQQLKQIEYDSNMMIRGKGKLGE